MKSHLQERIISAVWLGGLGCLFAYNYGVVHPIEITGNSLFILMFCFSTILFFYGLLYGYQTLLLPADHPNTILFRSTAGIWFMSGVYFLLYYFHLYEHFGLECLFIISMAAFLIGAMYLYHFLLLPHLKYIRLFPHTRERLISTLWFAILGYGAAVLLKSTMQSASIFVSLFAAYFGYAYGYRILLLKSSSLSMMFSIILGIVGATSILVSIFLFWFEISSVYLFIDFIGTVFPYCGGIAGLAGVAVSLSFYLLSRLTIKRR